MATTLTIAIEYDTDGGGWHCSSTSRTDGTWELAASEPCGESAGIDSLIEWSVRLMRAWAAPPLFQTPSESLHDAFASHP